MVDFVKDLGYPEKFGYPHYALYQPVLDRILLVAGDKDQITKVRNLATIRMFSIICRLDGAQNYEQNLIDNSCCEHWTIGRDPGFDYTHVDDHEILHVPYLQCCRPCEAHGIDIDQEKTWLEYVWYWTRFLDWLPFFLVRWYNQQVLVRSLMPVVFDDYDSEVHRLDQYVTGIQKSLFWAKDIDRCDADIRDFIARHDDLKLAFQKWSTHE